MTHPSVNSIVERLQENAVYVAPLGSASGDARWTVAQALREAATIISELQADSIRQEYSRIDWINRALTAESSLSRIKAETIEECAVVAQNLYFPVLPDQMTTRELLKAQREQVASAIRSLGSTGGGDAEEGSTQKEGSR